MVDDESCIGISWYVVVLFLYKYVSKQSKNESTNEDVCGTPKEVYLIQKIDKGKTKNVKEINTRKLIRTSVRLFATGYPVLLT